MLLVECSDCEQKISEKASDEKGEDLTGGPETSIENSINENNKRIFDGKKKIIVAAGLGIVVAFVLFVAALCMKGMFRGGESVSVNAPISAAKNMKKMAYVPLMDGNTIQFENVSEAYITPDREHIVVINTDGECFFTDQDQSKKVKVSETAEKIRYLMDEGVIYCDKTALWHRYIFENESDVILGKTEDIEVSASDLNIAFVNDDNEVYSLTGDSDESIKLGNYEDNCRLLSVSDDGKTVFWEDYNDDEVNVYIYADEEKTKICTFETESAGTCVFQNADNDYAVIVNDGSDELFILQGTDEPIKAELGNKISSPYIYTENGMLNDDEKSKFSGVYIALEGENEESNLYYIDKKGNRERVVSNIGEFTIYNGHLYYIDENKNLKNAVLSGEKIRDEKKIAGDVESISSTCRNGYLYFVRDMSSKNSTGSLYVSRKGEEPIKITSDMSFYKYDGYTIGRYPWIMLQIEISQDGRSVYYYQDEKDIDDSYEEVGELYRFTYGASDSEKISSDVLIYSLNSGLTETMINDKSFIYKKFSTVRDEKVLADWFYFDGKESHKMASNVIS